MADSLQPAVVEKLVRELVYKQLGKGLPRSAHAPNQLLVNISARQSLNLFSSCLRISRPGEISNQYLLAGKTSLLLRRRRPARSR